MTPLQLIECKRDGGKLQTSHWMGLLSARRAGAFVSYHQAAFNVAVAIRGLDASEKASLLGVLAAEGVMPEELELSEVGVERSLFGGHLPVSTTPYHAVIAKKIRGERLSTDEIEGLVQGITDRSVSDATLAAFTMAVFLQGMTPDETRDLTIAMLRSGESLSWPALKGKVVDKHSTGGVGDKVSLPLAGALIACGLKVPMLSGRGLGHTGGTLDKLQAIPGYRVDLNTQEIQSVVHSVGGMIIGQTSSLAPADRRMYAIRDVCGTVSNIPLITASILSKKLAEGLDALVLDVKVGDGAFMKSLESAQALAKSLVTVGTAAGVKVRALLTDMSAPIGEAVGNANEVEESVRCLRGQGPADLEDLVCALGAELLEVLGFVPSVKDGYNRIQATLHDGSALKAFREMVVAQGGSGEAIDRCELLPSAPHEHTLVAKQSGFIQGMPAERIGRAVVALGGGRLRQEDAVDPAVGIQVLKRPGDAVVAGEVILKVRYREGARLQAALEWLAEAWTIGPQPPVLLPAVLDVVR